MKIEILVVFSFISIFHYLSKFQATTNGYTNVGFGLKPTFAKGVKDNFMAEVEQLNFVQNVASASAASINGWVEETTQGKIRNLIKPGKD